MKKTNKILILSLIIILPIAFFFSYKHVASWGPSSEADNDMDCLDDNPNTPDNPDGSCDECGNGGFGGGSSCSPVYTSCVSEANVCGWTNIGTEDVSCGGGCSATRPEDPKFNINGELKSVGDSCSVTDACGNTVSGGVVLCDGTCSVSHLQASCITGSPNTPTSTNPTNPTDDPDFSEITTVISIPITGSGGAGAPNANGPNSWPPSSDDTYVAIYAIPQIVQKGHVAKLMLVTLGLDYCEVVGDNGDSWNIFGISAEKLNLIKNKDCESLTANTTNNNAPAQTDSEDSYTCPEEKIIKDPNINVLANYAATKSSPLTTATRFTINKCYKVNHNGAVLEYVPLKDNGDKPGVTVKVTPKFIEF